MEQVQVLTEQDQVPELEVLQPPLLEQLELQEHPHQPDHHHQPTEHQPTELQVSLVLLGPLEPHMDQDPFQDLNQDQDQLMVNLPQAAFPQLGKVSVHPTKEPLKEPLEHQEAAQADLETQVQVHQDHLTVSKQKNTERK